MNLGEIPATMNDHSLPFTSFVCENETILRNSTMVITSLLLMKKKKIEEKIETMFCPFSAHFHEDLGVSVCKNLLKKKFFL